MVPDGAPALRESIKAAPCRRDSASTMQKMYTAPPLATTIQLLLQK
jgi:hypothetical protein